MWPMVESWIRAEVQANLMKNCLVDSMMITDRVRKMESFDEKQQKIMYCPIRVYVKMDGSLVMLSMRVDPLSMLMNVSDLLAFSLMSAEQLLAQQASMKLLSSSSV